MDPFREAVWRLSLDGQTRGWVTTSVMPMRSFPFFWDKQEQMWTQVHWTDGRHEYCEEDYGPDWYVVQELRGGHFSTWDPSADHDVNFDATVLTGTERDHLWTQLAHGLEPSSRN
ncbi:hypothetical protein [Citricoccus sp. I39-566]|uniref:hypothetical protein n=1 Tax=Citricoccus sp. I39-566 TaxID=3073268 RepID=UPI00286B85AC|nr:hypothetical protein [Citricoccus sp. I39-566]WMY79479.1 hypothetical protein RE421_06380 [Citricoccus sp. I39-566]